MEEQSECTVRFPGISAADADRAATELRDALAGTEGLTIERRRKPGEQNLGSDLILLISTPAMLAVAQGIRMWIAKRGSRVVITTKDGTVIAEGDAATNIDVKATVAALKRKS